MRDTYRVIEAYGHNNRVGVLVEFHVSDEFTARMPEFCTLVKDVAVHIAAADPSSVDELLGQAFVKNPEETVRDHVGTVSRALRSSITITRFVRWDNESQPEHGPDRRGPVAAALRRRA